MFSIQQQELNASSNLKIAVSNADAVKVMDCVEHVGCNRSRILENHDIKDILYRDSRIKKHEPFLKNDHLQ